MPLSRLLVLCEGHTEAEFVKVVLRWHLAGVGYHSVAARLFGYHHSRARRGGIVRWPQARRDIVRHLKQDAGVIVTTMVDYYGLPSAGPNGWPGRRTSESEPDIGRRAAVVEAAAGDDIAAALRPSQAGDRFVPFVMLHEFEAVLLSDCRKFADAVAGFGDDLPATEMAARLEGIRRSHATPEEIDDDPRESPSKRIQEVIPGYRKRSMGPQATRAIGIPAMTRARPPLCVMDRTSFPSHSLGLNSAATIGAITEIASRADHHDPKRPISNHPLPAGVSPEALKRGCA